MKIYYSPYFNGHTYVNYASHNGGLIGEVVESTEGLLSRLELMYGRAYPDETDDFKERRVAEYYDALKPLKGYQLSPSVENDDPAKKRYNVTTEILRWRDCLILAGWDMKSQLPGKLEIISEAEKEVKKGGYVARGSADRWKCLLEVVKGLKKEGKNLKNNIHIVVCCPEKLIEPLIQYVIKEVDENADYLKVGDEALKDCTVIEFVELYEAYEWLALQNVKAGQVVVCNDGQRLDNIMNCFAKPTTSGDAKKGCHHVINDVRSYLDVPQSLIWIDCNGDYGFRYPYDFLSDSEKGKINLSIPQKQDMLAEVHNHFVRQLNQVEDVTLVCSKFDAASLLTQHPMVASALYKNGQETKPNTGDPNVATRDGGWQIRFKAQPEYDINKDVDVANPVMSYSSLEQLIMFPFNFVVERELGLYEPYAKEDVRTEKGNVAHRVVRFLFHNYGSNDLNITKTVYDECFGEACTLKDDHTTAYKSILLADENRFELEDLKFKLWESLQVLRDILATNNLEIVDSEAEIPAGAKANNTSVDLDDFGASKAYIDLILKKKDADEYYIFDFKYSMSSTHPDKLAENKSIQFAFYKEIFAKYYNEEGRNLVGIGYYLFPKKTLYVPDNFNGNLKGDAVEEVHVDTSKVADTLKSMKASFDFRMDQLKKGKIEEGEGMPVADDYNAVVDHFPMVEEYNKKDIKGSPYTPNHIVLKNQIR